MSLRSLVVVVLAGCASSMPVAVEPAAKELAGVTVLVDANPTVEAGVDEHAQRSLQKELKKAFGASLAKAGFVPVVNEDSPHRLSAKLTAKRSQGPFGAREAWHARLQLTDEGGVADEIQLDLPASEESAWDQIDVVAMRLVSAMGNSMRLARHLGARELAGAPPAPPVAAPAPASSPPATGVPASGAPPTGSACPPGQIVTEDTDGRCCWPGQVWMAARARCEGLPARCPRPLVPRNEGCVQP